MSDTVAVAPLLASEGGADGQPVTGQPVDVLCMACADGGCDFKPVQLQRRPLGDRDVLMDMVYCGVCHSDLHFAAGHMNGLQRTTYPCVPGHELVGVVAAIGAGVTKVALGQHVGVGCMVDSCMKASCKACQSGEEQKCMKQVATYLGKDNGSGRAATYPAGGHTIGGYSSRMVVDENFAVRIPEGYPLECAGPVMCAGVTMYDPLVKVLGGGRLSGDTTALAGKRVGVVGLGGLGAMGMKIAKALGCEVSAISRTRSKEAFARECGASSFVVSGDAAAMTTARRSLDLILNTVPTYHDYCAYNGLLAKGGKQVLLGLHKGLGGAMVVNALTGGRSKVMMSGIGGVAATQAVVDLCAAHDIRPNVEVVGVEKINEVYAKLDGANPDAVRYVLDLAGTLNDEAAAKCTAPPPVISKFSGGLSPCAVIGECCWLLCCCKW